MPNFVDNIDLFDASGDPTNILLQDRTTLALLTNTVARINSLLVYNVKEYGATGDGNTDDTDAINTAIAAYNLTGGILYFPYGTYVVNDAFTPLSKRGKIVGDYARITSTLNTNDTLLDIEADNVLIDHIYFEGSGGLCISTYRRTSVYNCTFDGFDRHISIDDSVLVMIFNNYFVNSGEMSIHIENTQNVDSGDNRIIGNTWDWDSTGQIAIGLQKGGGLICTNNKFLHCTTALYEYVDQLSTAVCIFSNNSIENFTHACVAFTSELNGSAFGKTVIANNEIMASGTAAAILFSDYIDNVVVSGNYIQGSLTTNQYCFVFGVDKTGRNITISENNIQSFYGFALMYLNSPYLSIHDNDIDENCNYFVMSPNVANLSPEVEMQLKGKDVIGVVSNSQEFFIGCSPYSVVKVKVTLEDSTTNDYLEAIVSANDNAATVTDIVESLNSILSLTTSGLGVYINVSATVSQFATLTVDIDGQVLTFKDLAN